MSNALAIATVTTALAQIVRTAAQSAVNGAEVVTGRPDPNATPSHRIHLFLYQVLPNASWRNLDLPTRSADGKVVNRPTAALDLHYLLAFYGSETELETQRMLGAVVRELHSKPVLTRQMVRDAVASQPFLTGSNLADAVEQVRFAPLPVTVEEMSKIWSVFFQTPYALSVAYQGTVVLIEAEEGGQPALPVLTRGKEDRGVETFANARSTFPSLDSIHIGPPQDTGLDPLPPSYPGAQLGLRLILRGQNLNGDVVRVHFRHKRFAELNHPRYLPPKDILVEPANRTATEIRIDLPDDLPAQTEWRVGCYAVSVKVETADKTIHSTNDLEFLLAPRINSIAPPNPVNRVGGNATLSITCSPQVLKEQTVTLSLTEGMNEINANIRSLVTDPLVFVIENAPQLTDVPVRLHVDGVYSQPFERKFEPKDKPPRLEYADNQKVTIT